MLETDGRTFLDQMCCETIDASFRELFAARFAGVLIPVAGIVKFRASLEVSEDQRYGAVSRLIPIKGPVSKQIFVTSKK